MNGAESLVRSLVGCGVEVCFANPGTSEMHFVAALDTVGGLRPVLALAEGVATGAADGYGRMAEKPACTLLHLGPGLANGLSNLHNARKAATPIVNIVGNHAASHMRYDAPLSADVEGFARPVSGWIRSATSARTVAADAVMAVRAACEPPGQIATLILPADTAWDEADGAVAPLPPSQRALVDEGRVSRIARTIRGGARTAVLLRGAALRGAALTAAGRMAASSGARLFADTFAPRLERGAGRPIVERLPYFGEAALRALTGFDLLLLVGAQPPVSFFGYPGRPSWLTPEGCRIEVLAHPHEDGARAVVDLAATLGADKTPPALAPHEVAAIGPDGPLTAEAVMLAVARQLPADAIVADESISSGLPFHALTATAAPHDYLHLTGGAIGSMMAVATGAALACPGRRLVTLQGDGSAMYILQALWTQARERLDVVTIIYANRAYRILETELDRVGSTGQGSRAATLLDIGDPVLDWVKLAAGMGVEGVRADTVARFETALATALRRSGPMLIEAVL